MQWQHDWPPCCCVWADWTCWTHSWSSAVSALHPLCSRNTHLSRMCEPETQAWSGTHTLRWTPPRHLPFLSPSLALHPPLPCLPCPPPLPPHPQLAAEDGFSESSWDPDQREIIATSMQNVMWKPPSSVLTIDSSPSTFIPMLSVRPSLLVSLPRFIVVQCEIRRRKKPPQTFYKRNRKDGMGVPGYACLHLQSIS